MEQLARYFEEIHLGVVHNPHTNKHEALTEMVTVCPSCHSLNSLRHDGDVVHCQQCYWSTPVVKPMKAA